MTDRREEQFLEVLAAVSLPERWADLAGAGMSALPTDLISQGVDLSDVERMTRDLGVPFVPKEYDDEDYWPLRRTDRFADHLLVQRVRSPDPAARPSHRLTFELEIVVPGEGGAGFSYGRPLARLVGEIRDRLDRPDLGSEIPDMFLFGGHDDARRAVGWFVDLFRDVAARTVRLDWRT